MIYTTGRRDRCDLSGHPYLCTPLLTVIPTNSKSNIAGAQIGARRRKKPFMLFMQLARSTLDDP